jgi:hypothetical protein
MVSFTLLATLKAKKTIRYRRAFGRTPLPDFYDAVFFFFRGDGLGRRGKHVAVLLIDADQDRMHFLLPIHAVINPDLRAAGLRKQLVKGFAVKRFTEGKKVPLLVARLQDTGSHLPVAGRHADGCR